ncbi:MAG: hypothetical protein PHH11_03760 [Methylomonas sp.]|nr:hypothetical protein [Methylomonas sp.]
MSVGSTRGFVQLTGRANYAKYGEQLNLDLVHNPKLANDPKIATRLLALFLKNNANKIRQSLAEYDLAGARRVVNGDSHGLNDFKNACTIRNSLLE